MIISVCVISKDGEKIMTNIKDSRQEQDYYKICGFTHPDGFVKITSWNVSPDVDLVLYGKCSGPQHRINTFIFHAQVPTIYGKCLLVAKNNKTSNLVPLTLETIAGAFSGHTEMGGNINAAQYRCETNDYECVAAIKIAEELKEEPYV